MKKVTKTITVEKTVFVAEDGKEFETQSSCTEYEYTSSCAISAQYNACVVGNTNAWILFAGDSDSIVDIVDLSIKDNITIVLKYIKNNCNSSDKELANFTLMLNAVALSEDPHAIILWNYDHDWCHVYGNKEMLFNNISGHINKILNNETEKKNG